MSSSEENVQKSGSLYPDLARSPQEQFTENGAVEKIDETFQQSDEKADIPVTNQPVPIEVPISQDFVSATEEQTILLDSQRDEKQGAITKQPGSTSKKTAPQFSSKLCGCCEEDLLCMKALCLPCASVYSIEKELSNETKGAI